MKEKWEANDGTLFDTKEMCERYEKNNQEIIDEDKKLKAIMENELFPKYEWCDDLINASCFIENVANGYIRIIPIDNEADMKMMERGWNRAGFLVRDSTYNLNYPVLLHLDIASQSVSILTRENIADHFDDIAILEEFVNTIQGYLKS